MQFLYFAGLEYTKLTGKFCPDSVDGEFSSIDHAKEKCFYDEQCKGLYFPGCDDSHHYSLRLCYIGTRYDEDTYDCVYEKEGNF